MITRDRRLALAKETLEGLAVGDALGEALSYQCQRARERRDFSALRAGSFCFTDDTAMALGVVECLHCWGGIDEDALAQIFAKNFKSDPDRGYGKMTRRILAQVSDGAAWQEVSSSAFGEGSFGNGSAMRVAPLGAYFFDDLREVREMATASARVTHFHPEGVAGAVAVAVAAAQAVASRPLPPEEAAQRIWESVLEFTPDGQTARMLKAARSLGRDGHPADVAKAVGCGYDVSCPDTVPFAVWNACRCLGDFREALLSTVEVGGDCDTNAAIVCAIVASHGSSACILEDWRRVCEPLPGV